MYTEDEEGFKKIIESEVIGSYLLDVKTEENGKKCQLILSNGTFEFYTPYDVSGLDNIDIKVESLVGYAIEYVNDVWDDIDNDNSRFEVVFDSGSKIYAHYLQYSEHKSEYDTEKYGKEVNYTISYTSSSGNQFSSGMMYI